MDALAVMPAPTAVADPADAAFDAHTAAWRAWTRARSPDTARAVVRTYAAFCDAFMGVPRFGAEHDARHALIAAACKSLGITIADFVQGAAA